LKLMGELMGANFGGEDDSAPAPSRQAPTPKAPEPQPEPQPELTEEEREKQAIAQKAAAEKDLGNVAYKKKRFDEAIDHYNKAIEIDSTNMSFRLNLAAAYFEKENYAKCRELCLKAIEVGQAHHADYALVAKAFARIGSAYVKEGNLEEAIHFFDKSLTEKRTPDVLAKLNKAEKDLKQQREREYQDPAKATEAKEKGNEAFRGGDNPEAVKWYGEAIKRNPTDAVLYSNRAAALMRLAEYPTALKDCDKCIELNPEFVKGYTRKANCHFFMGEHAKALKAYEQVLKLDPHNKEAEDGMYRVQAAMRKGRSEMTDEQRQQAMRDPEIQQILADPVMRQILEQMSQDPEAVQDHLRNPAIMQKVQQLMNAGVIQMG
jgi:stress-induced-phosphoprotein 1